MDHAQCLIGFDVYNDRGTPNLGILLSFFPVSELAGRTISPFSSSTGIHPRNLVPGCCVWLSVLQRSSLMDTSLQGVIANETSICNKHQKAAQMSRISNIASRINTAKHEHPNITYDSHLPQNLSSTSPFPSLAFPPFEAINEPHSLPRYRQCMRAGMSFPVHRGVEDCGLRCGF